MPPDDPNERSPIERALEGVNAGYIAEMHDRWQSDPASVDPEWRALFEPAIPPSDGQPTTPRSADAAEPPTTVTAAPLPSGATPLRGPAARLARNMTA